MEISFNVDESKLEDVILKSVERYVLDNHVEKLIHKNDGQLKILIISTCTKAVYDVFKGEAFNEWIKTAIQIEIGKVKSSIEHHSKDYAHSINEAIKEEVRERVKSIVNKPGFDHYIMGCVQLEVRDKLLTIE